MILVFLRLKLKLGWRVGKTLLKIVSKVPTTATNEECIISFSAKYGNIPVCRADFIASYRKKNRSVRHEYYSLATKHASLGKSMLTFTVGRGGTYSKLRLINEVKSYVTYLIANSNAEIYYFSNIELGHSFTNPHLHTQVWCNDSLAIKAIYEKVIKKFGLVRKRCSLSEPQHQHSVYHYVLKDYSESLTDDRLLEIESVKKKYRKQLGLRVRFYSRSKSKYQKALYHIAYRIYGVLREFADEWLDLILGVFFNKEAFLSAPISSFITIKNKGFIVLLWSAKRCLMSKSYFLMSIFRRGLDILFFSPARDPPLLLQLFGFSE